MNQVLSTHRLQFHSGYTFADAKKSIDYFASLGVSHLYASPITTSQPGSTHGYDTVDYRRVNPELGGEAGLRDLVQALRERGMGLIVDIVPNHMGVGGAHNAWWLDILEWGRHAEHARYFDIDWHSPDPALRGKVLAPFLGESFGEALSTGKLTLCFDPADGRFYTAYYDHRFPICPADYARLALPAAQVQPSTFAEPSGRNTDTTTAAVATAAPAVSSATAALATILTRFEAIDHQPADQENAVRLRAELMAFALEDAGRRAIETLLARFNAPTVGGRDALQRLLDRQHYRLAWWRTASDEVNWRRFFDISALAGMRVERTEVFDASHALILRLYAQGWIDGVRIDHVDGLAEPREYCQRLRARLEQAHTQRAPAQREHPPYLVIEKILARGEAMRTDWKVDGTTGYDFLNDVGALLHDPAGAAPLAQIWTDWSGRSPMFEHEALAARHKILEENLSAERDRCARALHRLARDDFATRDFTFTSIRRVLTALVVHFPVYRIYPQDNLRSAEDQKYFGKALAGARNSLQRADHPLLAQMDSWLGGEESSDGTATQASCAAENTAISKPGDRPMQRDPRIGQRRMALTLFSQLTSPAAAKSVEDTACYRYGRLISRNEVGADPDDFALSVEDFHAINTDRAKHFPHAMLTTATHDHKRGEDVRARIAVLSEIPLEWGAALRRWSQHNHRNEQTSADTNANANGQAPGPGFESMLYQTLIGCWPPTLRVDDAQGMKQLAERVSQWQEKALREAKLETDWSAPNEAYEAASRDFLFAILSPEQRDGFLPWLHAFVDAIAPAAVINALQQALLRLTVPGVPDTYQGTDLWDMSLVDPDNRRPVDYPQHARFLASLDARRDHSQASPGALLKHWQDGRIKQLVVHRALVLRKRLPALFLDGSYIPLEVRGSQSRSVLAFARQHGDDWLVVVVTRLAAGLLGIDQALALGDGVGTLDAALPLVPLARWEDTAVVLPAALRGTALFDHLGGRLRSLTSLGADHAPVSSAALQSTANASDASAAWALSDLLDQLPVALLCTVAK